MVTGYKFFLTSVSVLLCLLTGCDRTLENTQTGHTTPAATEETGTSAAESVSTKQWKAFEGEWSRSNVVKSLGATLVVTEADEEGFDFELVCMYYSHSGEVHDRASFVSDTKAVCQVSESFGEKKAVLNFEMQGGSIVLTAEGGTLPFGMNVTADGEYVKGEPIYTNANILSETFSDAELESIKKAVQDDEIYEEVFRFAVEYGAVSVEDCELALDAAGTPARVINAFVPTMGGYDFVMLITEDGRVYIDFGSGNIPYKTNVPGAVDFPEYTRTAG